LTEKKEKNLLVSIWEGIFAAITTGCGETYMSPFAIALGAGNIQVGLLTSLPVFISSLLQLKTPDVAHALGSRKKFINTFISFQILMWVPLLCIPFLSCLSTEFRSLSPLTPFTPPWGPLPCRPGVL